MPNWCNNNLHVYGPDAEVRRFKGMAVGTSPWDTEDGGKQNVLNFHNLVPIPPEILAADYNDAGFHWERMHWGCKWGARHAVLLDERDGLSTILSTPRGCPQSPFSQGWRHSGQPSGSCLITRN